MQGLADINRIDWSGLRTELAIWEAEGLSLPFWWRDDDAVTPTHDLDRLVSLAQDHDIPVHLAIIPAGARAALGPFLSGHHLRGVVHGWSHRNMAPPDQKTAEFGTPRPDANAELDRGLRHLNRLFGPVVSPMFVPPWNRISPDLLPQLAKAGYTALSTYQPRQSRTASGLVLINTHIDPVDWKGTRSLANPAMILAQLVENLQDRRAGRTDASEPLGLLTHHLAHDNLVWDFTHALLSELRKAPLEIFDITNTQDLP